MNRRTAILSIAAAGAGPGLLAAEHKPAAQGGHSASPANPSSASYISTADGAALFYRDWGTGKPLVFIHGLGMSTRQWQYNMLPLSSEGLRCIAYDRRGHGLSSDPGRGYDFDTLAADLAALMDQLDLHGSTLVGHSMAGGEIVRYLSRYGSSRVSRIVLVGTTLPFVLKTADNLEGVDPAALERLRAEWCTDHPRWIKENARPFFTPDTSDAMIEWGIRLATESSFKAMIDCQRAFSETDFRAETAAVSVPTLLIHGDKDASAQIDFTGRRTAQLIRNSVFKVYEGAAHGLFITHAKRFNEDVRAFVMS